jgi:cytosine/adenosine deaminase-related metal-dependent hydrolase
LQAYAAAAADPLVEYQWLFERLAGWADSRLARRLAREELVPRLLQRRRTGEALQVVRRCLVMDPAFRPGDARQLLQLVQLARDAGDRTVARRLLSDFELNYPQDDALNAAQRLSAELERK